MRPSRPRWLLPLAAFLLACAVAAIVVAAVRSSSRGSPSSGSPAPAGTAGPGGGGFEGAPLPGHTPAPSFTLDDIAGRPVSPAEYRGRVLVIGFLYSSCAACTLVAQQLRGALDDLGRPVATLLVSVDPATDRPGQVERFLRSVHLAGRVRYLVGPPEELARVWRAYRITTPAAGRSAFEAAVTLLLVDRRGRERVLFQPEQLTPEALAHDIGTLERG